MKSFLTNKSCCLQTYLQSMTVRAPGIAPARRWGTGSTMGRRRSDGNRRGRQESPPAPPAHRCRERGSGAAKGPIAHRRPAALFELEGAGA